MKELVIRCFALSILGVSVGGADTVHSQTLPFVGCSMDAQGLVVVPPPKRAPIPTAVNAAEGVKLAYYDAGAQGSEISVIAPRGWTCSADSGASGGSLIVSPSETAVKRQLTGPEVTSWFVGGYSGSDIVAAYAERFFPKLIPSYVHQVFRDDAEIGASKTVFPADPSDVITYRSRDILEFMTPARREGLGTWYSGVTKSDLPIYGLLAVGDGRKTDNFAFLLTARLPPKLQYLRRDIIEQAARSVATSLGR